MDEEMTTLCNLIKIRLSSLNLVTCDGVLHDPFFLYYFTLIIRSPRTVIETVVINWE